MYFCTRCGTPRDAGATLCSACGIRFNDPDADHPVYSGIPADQDTRADLGEPYQEPQPTIWDYGVPRTPPAWEARETSGWAASPAMQDYEAPLLPGFDSGEHAAPSHGYYTEPQPVPADPWAAQPALPPAGRPPSEGRPGGHRRPPDGRQRGTLIAAGVLLVLALGGGAYAVTSALTGHSERPSAQGNPATAPTTPAARTSPLPASTPPATTPAQAPATTPPPATTPAQVTPTTEPPDTEPATEPAPGSAPPTATQSPPAPGTTAIAATSAARASPAEPRVAKFLSDYFTAINHHDYQAYIALLDPAQAAKETPARFAAGYGTTTDSDATLTSVADLGGGREAAAVTFTSHQAPSASPDKSSCDVWSITLFLRPNGGSYLIRHPQPGYAAHVRSCS